jgi:hypothetical protein
VNHSEGHWEYLNASLCIKGRSSASDNVPVLVMEEPAKSGGLGHACAGDRWQELAPDNAC